MHHSYSGSVLSGGCKGSLSFSLHDYNYCFNDRYERTSIASLSSPSSCCSCCANSIYRSPIRPYFLHGLRQSTLIQRSPYKRWIWGGCDTNFSWLPVCELDRNCYYAKYCTIKTRGVFGRRRWQKGRYDYMVSAERSEKHRLGGMGDAEAMLNLLTEETHELCFDLRERIGKSSRKVQVEKIGKNGGTCYSGKKKNVDSGLLECKSRCEYESVMAQSSEEGKIWKEDRTEEERGHFLSSENRSARGRKEGSSCSSYYSFSSSGECESDDEVEVKREGFVEESSSGYTIDKTRKDENKYNGKIRKGDERQGYYGKEHRDVLKKENVKAGSHAAPSSTECDWRKKSEKKLPEVSFDETGSRKESVQKHSRFSEVHESGQSGSYKQYYDKEENVGLAVNTDERKRGQYNHTADWVSGQSETRTKYKHLTDIPETHGTDVERTTRSQKQRSSREKNVDEYVNLVQDSRGEHHKTTGHITRQDEYRRNSQQLDEVSDSHEINVRVTSVSQTPSEIGVKKTQSDTRVSNQEEISNLTFGSFPEREEQHFQIDHKDIRRLESRRGLQDVSSASMVHYSDTETITNALGVSEERLNSQGRSTTSAVKSDKETGEIYSVTDERISQIGPRKEHQRPTKVLSFHEDMAEKASSSQASLQLNFQTEVLQIGLDEKNKQCPEVILTPPSSQLVTRSPFSGAPGLAPQGVSSESLKGGSSALLTHTQESSPALQDEIYGRARRGDSDEESLNVIHHGDALSSAQQLEQSSTQFIGEFVEKIRQEVSTSEIQKEKKIYETKLVHRDEQREQKISSLHSSGDSQSKAHNLSHSSRGSGAKGPSDEMWDVADPSNREASKTKVQEETAAAKKAVVKRTGRSLWNIIGDIVHLRWTSRSETHSSAPKSGVRSSPKQSTSSDTWFSGHEPDENNDENVKKETDNSTQELPSVDQQQCRSEELASVHQQQLGRILAQSQGRSGPISSRDKIKNADGSFPSSSSIMESESTSKVISPALTEETFGENIEGASSGSAVAETTLPLPAVQIKKSPVSGEISESGKSDASGSGNSGNNAELKRRKLQRSSQFPRDSFDEWEEAYRVEAEQRKIDEMFMREALLEAQKAADNWETPVGAVLVQRDKVIARGCNLVEELRDSTAHAEMICIREASNMLHTWRLSETTLYVTLEPCPMCAGAILQARIDTVVWGAPNKLLGADGSWIRLFPNGNGEHGLESTDKPAAPVHPFHPKMMIRRGVLASECADVMQQFFQLRRKKKEKKQDPPTPPHSCLPVPNHPSKFFTKLHDAFNIMFCFH